MTDNIAIAMTGAYDMSASRETIASADTVVPEQPHKNESRLLTLPPESRNLIMQHLFASLSEERAQAMAIKENDFEFGPPQQPAITKVCKQLRHETSSSHYTTVGPMTMAINLSQHDLTPSLFRWFYYNHQYIEDHMINKIHIRIQDRLSNVFYLTIDFPRSTWRLCGSTTRILRMWKCMGHWCRDCVWHDRTLSTYVEVQDPRCFHGIRERIVEVAGWTCGSPGDEMDVADSGDEECMMRVCEGAKGD